MSKGKVLVVDDDPFVLKSVRATLEGAGYDVATYRSAITVPLELREQKPDLVLLDITMPDGSGIDVLRGLRARAAAVDVIAITGVRDAATVRQMAALGVYQYLVKPFPFAVFHERLTAYRTYREQARSTAGEATQAEIDALLGRTTGTIPIPKGLSAATLQKVTSELRSSGAPVSASEAAARLGMSRVSVRRYLEHLTDSGIISRSARYGARGRPETEYRWIRRTDAD
jgi:response regulator of citrate/malate metabolism